MARASTLYDKKIILASVRENEVRSKRFRDLANEHMINQNSSAYLERIAEKEREADNVDDFTKNLEKREEYMVDRFSATKAEEG